MSVFTQDIVEVGWVKQNLDSGKIKIFDVAYTIKDKPDPAQFEAEMKGKWDKLLAQKNEDYEKEHIPGAIHWNLDAAQFPSAYERFALYPPHEFFVFMRKLGLNDDDHVVFYGRGLNAGMFFAARAWWMLKVYGHPKVSVMNGGLDAWKKAGHPVDNKPVTVKEGGWFAKPMNFKLWVTFDEMEEKRSSGKTWFQDATQINLFDVRSREEFEGKEQPKFPYKACGAHIPGSKNLPLSELMGPNGFKTKEEIEKVLEGAGLASGKPVVVMCNGGIGAANLVLAMARNGRQARLYNGGFMELGIYGPQYITATGPK